MRILSAIVLMITSTCAFAQSESMRANLYILPTPSTRVLVDGNYTQYDDAYSNDVDMNDVWKMTNIGENFGIIRQGHTLVMERRRVIGIADTSYFRFWNMQQRTYQVEIITKNCNHPDLKAYMEDAFTSQRTQVQTSDTTRITFDITSNPASYAQDRFRLIYKLVPTNALPLFMSSIQAQRNKDVVSVNWSAENENEVSSYTLERSVDGVNFTAINSVSAVKNNRRVDYVLNDVSPSKGSNYYRVKAENIDGKITLTNIVNMNIADVNAMIAVYPNPVTGKTLKLQTRTIGEGIYTIRLIHSSGKEMFKTNITLNASSNQSLALPSTTPQGLYHLLIMGPNGFRQAEKVIIL